MKILGLVLALVMVVGGACVADSVTMNVASTFAMVATPIAPYDGTAQTLWANVFATFTSSAGPKNVLSTLSFGNSIAYDPTAPGDFPAIMLGQGYWIRTRTGSASVTINGFPDGLADTTGGAQTDMWISLPGNAAGTGGAWHMIGQPFDHDTLATDILFTDGTDVKNWADAVAASWVYKIAQYSYGGMSGRVSYTDTVVHEDDRFRARHGYQIQTRKANLAMIIPALPIAPAQ